jgi:DHA1 family bicyclomycin/chloramphenicol resistance-like MFS transporter
MFKPDTIALTSLLALLTAFGPVATDMYVPSMPEIGRLLGADVAKVQLTLSAYLIGFAIGQIGYGPVADRFGRRPTLLVALAIFCTASLACALAANIEFLIIARAFQALGGAGAIVLARAMVRDLYAGERAGQELSRMGAIMSIAPVLAPLIGGVVQTAWGWRANFVIIAGIGLITALITWRSLPETLHRDSMRPIRLTEILQGYRALAIDKSFLAHLGIISCVYAGLFAWISGSPFVLQNLYGLSPIWFGVAFAFACIGALAGGGLASSLVLRIGLDRTIGLGALALALGGLAMIATVMSGVTPVISLVMSMAVYHMGVMLAMPQAIAGAMTPFPNCAGTASSFIGFVQQTSAAVLGAIVGHTLANSAWPLAAAIALTGCSTAVLWVFSRRTRTGVHPRSTDLLHAGAPRRPALTMLNASRN